MRSFDPRAVGRLECRAWETYYRRKWGACLVAFVLLVRAAFGMSWPRTLVGAWLVLRARRRPGCLVARRGDGRVRCVGGGRR